MSSSPNDIQTELIIRCVESHLVKIKEKSEIVKDYLEQRNEPELIKAWEQALADLRTFADMILNGELDLFLNTLLKFERLLNQAWTTEENRNQKYWRDQYSRSIVNYENSGPVIMPLQPGEDMDIVSLVLKKDNTMGRFKDFYKKIKESLDENGISYTATGAQGKGIERVFFKVFYEYDGDCTRLTDMLRGSFVFDDFKQLYAAFSIIERLSTKILRVKDRFDCNEVAYGYRDLMINLLFSDINDNLIGCEIQLHYSKFYEVKEESHVLYKFVRLFDDKDGNILYSAAKFLIKLEPISNESNKNSSAPPINSYSYPPINSYPHPPINSYPHPPNSYSLPPNSPNPYSYLPSNPYPHSYPPSNPYPNPYPPTNPNPYPYPYPYPTHPNPTHPNPYPYPPNPSPVKTRKLVEENTTIFIQPVGTAPTINPSTSWFDFGVFRRWWCYVILVIILISIISSVSS